MKIAVVGGGIAGAATYLNLEKHVRGTRDERFELILYEAHTIGNASDTRQNNIPSAGGGYGVASNGCASLRRLNPDIHAAILKAGYPAPRTTLKSARGWTIGTLPFMDTRGPHPECCIMVLRQVVLDALYAHITKSAVIHQKVVEVVDGDSHVTVRLENGEEATYDLVIGADGVWSRTRRAVLADKHSEYDAIYKGLFTVGGFVPTTCLSTPPMENQTIMTFGPNGFFGYTPYTTGDVALTESHIRGNVIVPPGDWAFWWARSEQKDPNANPDDEEVKCELRKRHSKWKDPSIQEILKISEVPLKIPTWTLPKLPKWYGKRIILVGDAAHALPSSSGQGVSQAIEDAEALSLLLSHNLADDNGKDLGDRLQKTFEQYTLVRKAHVEKILDSGNRAGDSSRDMGPVAEVLMCFLFWLMLKLFGPFFLKPLQNYDVVAEVDKVKHAK